MGQMRAHVCSCALQRYLTHTALTSYAHCSTSRLKLCLGVGLCYYLHVDLQLGMLECFDGRAIQFRLKLLAVGFMA